MKNMLMKVELGMVKAKETAQQKALQLLLKKREGIDGILVTVGLCIIALLLCVVMQDQLTSFIETLVGDMTTKAQGILGI